MFSVKFVIKAGIVLFLLLAVVDKFAAAVDGVNVKYAERCMKIKQALGDDIEPLTPTEHRKHLHFYINKCR